jgi:hypothetical protein
MTDKAPSRIVLAVWAAAAIGGSVAVWWLTSYLDSLTELARTDRSQALEMFRTRVVPPLVVVVLMAVAAGSLLLRHGLQIVRAGEIPIANPELREELHARGARPARTLGWVLAIAGFVVAAVPLVMISIVFWLLQRA